MSTFISRIKEWLEGVWLIVSVFCLLSIGGYFGALVASHVLALFHNPSKVLLFGTMVAAALLNPYVILNLLEEKILAQGLVIIVQILFLNFINYQSTKLKAPTRYQESFISGIQERERSKFLLRVCNMKAVCERYVEARSNCATAGQISECIDIKMTGEDTSQCTERGTVVDVPADVLPGKLQCAAIEGANSLR